MGHSWAGATMPRSSRLGYAISLIESIEHDRHVIAMSLFVEEVIYEKRMPPLPFTQRVTSSGAATRPIEHCSCGLLGGIRKYVNM